MVISPIARANLLTIYATSSRAKAVAARPAITYPAKLVIAFFTGFYPDPLIRSISDVIVFIAFYLSPLRLRRASCSTTQTAQRENSVSHRRIDACENFDSVWRNFLA